LNLFVYDLSIAVNAFNLLALSRLEYDRSTPTIITSLKEITATKKSSDNSSNKGAVVVVAVCARENKQQPHHNSHNFIATLD
jgi:hypothetical protein